MLVILSDLHLNDGTLGEIGGAENFRAFIGQLAALTGAASLRAGGLYRPIPQIDLLLLGDVFDLLRSSHWTETTTRPWHDPRSVELPVIADRIVRGILAANHEFVGLLRGLATKGVEFAPGQRAQVRLHYLVGDRDWMLRLPTPLFAAVRRQIVNQLYLTNPYDLPFPHDPAESDAVLETLRRHRVVARHGDIFDPVSFSGDRCTSSLGDAIVIELLNRFAHFIETELAADLPDYTLHILRSLDNVRPLLSIPAWLDEQLDRLDLSVAQIDRAKQVWNRLVARFLELEFVQTAEVDCPFDLVDGLRQVLELNRQPAARNRSLVNWLQCHSGSDDGGHHRHALAEHEFRGGRARYVVYGHTHEIAAQPLAAGDQTAIWNTAYFNPGSWRTAVGALAFFQGDEFQGRPYHAISATKNVQLPRQAA